VLNITVIIPTYNRENILKECLTALFRQTYPSSGFEIIVIDDGSTDGTESVVKKIIANSPVKLRYLKQENRGPAAARNAGIKNAQGGIVLFIGDDIIATETLIEEHMKWHESYAENNAAILGFVTWSPDIKITPFMIWLENGGPQFCYHNLKHGCNVPWSNFWTCNISLKKEFLLEYGIFDEDFPYAAYEDIELGYRLYKKGLRLLFNKSAMAYHYHYTSLDDACKRMLKVSRSKYIFSRKTTQEVKFVSKSPIGRFLSKVKFIIYYLAARFYEKRSIKEGIFLYIIDHYRFKYGDKYRKV
jgi:glycosyltransferase involved in cell wall biosynthesis